MKRFGHQTQLVSDLDSAGLTAAWQAGRPVISAFRPIHAGWPTLGAECRAEKAARPSLPAGADRPAGRLRPFFGRFRPAC